MQDPHSYDDKTLRRQKLTKPWRIIYSLLLRFADQSELVIQLDERGQNRVPNLQFDKSRAIDLRNGDVVKFSGDAGPPEFLTIQSIECFRDAFCETKPVNPDGFVVQNKMQFPG